MKTLMKFTMIALIFMLGMQNSYADEASDFLSRLAKITTEHSSMTHEQIVNEYQLGVDQAKVIFGADSEHYKLALIVLSEIKEMSLEEIGGLEAMKIMIIPLMGIKNMYKGRASDLMKEDRPTLLAALVLT